MDNQHRKIKTYRELDQQELDAINACKEMEQAVAHLYKELKELPGINPAYLDLGRLSIEHGFMDMVKAIANPVTPWE